MDMTYREYKKEDYFFCEEMVNVAWGFDRLFESKHLQSVAKYLYTKGSLVSSNYKYVAAHQGKVVGFIFGYNSSLSKNNLSATWLGLKATYDLNFKKMDKQEKQQFISIIKQHQKNRAKVELANNSEIVLFVVCPEFQGKGVGTSLWKGFKNFCSSSIKSRIQVETNRAGASAFYEKLGFHHRADFDSPLHNLATKGGQACIYEYVQ